MTDTILLNEKKLRKGEKFKKEETKGDIFRKKLKDSSESKSSNGKNIKTMNINNSLKNLKEDFRFPKIEKRELQPMQPLAKGGRAGLKGGGICKRGMNPKARGRNS